MKKRNSRLVLDIFLLIVLLTIYFLLDSDLNTIRDKKETNQTKKTIEEDYTPNSIKELNAEVKILNERIDKSKKYIDDYFFADPIGSKLKGILAASPGNTRIYINDNFELILKKEDNPIQIRYRDNVYELKHPDNIVNNSQDDDVMKNNDVIIVELAKGKNESEEIIMLKTYLQSMGRNHFENFIDKEIDRRTEEVRRIINITY